MVGRVHVICIFQCISNIVIPLASTKLIGGYTGITLSVCPSVDRIVSALYLQQYSSDPFHIYTSYQATSEGVSRVMPVSKFKNLKFWRIFLICNFDFVIFWLGIQYDSMVWVIMRRWGVSSERRRSSCSSFICFELNPHLPCVIFQLLTACGMSDKPIHLVGTSMGGALVALYAATYPDCVEKLTLICPASKLSEVWLTIIFPRQNVIIPPEQRSCWGVYWFHSVRPSVRLSVRSHETPLLWLVFGIVGNYVAISDYEADHTKRFQTISWNVSTCHMCLIS